MAHPARMIVATLALTILQQSFLDGTITSFSQREVGNQINDESFEQLKLREISEDWPSKKENKIDFRLSSTLGYRQSFIRVSIKDSAFM